MEERIENEAIQQIDLISMLKDIIREWITILLLSVSAALFADIWICATYQPEYKTSTTFVVTAKGMNNNISGSEQPGGGDVGRPCPGDKSDHTFR